MQVSLTRAIVFLAVAGAFWAGCSKWVDRRDSGPLDTSSSGEWRTLYQESFDPSSLDKNWIHLRGSSFDHLQTQDFRPYSWTIDSGRLKGRSVTVIAMRAKGKYAGDVEIVLRLAHGIRHRKWAVAFGGKSIEEGYCLLGDRAEIRLAKMNIANVLASEDLRTIPDADKTEIRLRREGCRIGVWINGKRVMDHVDYAPPLSPGYDHVTIACQESVLEIEGLEILGKVPEEKDPVIRTLMEDFRQGHTSMFIENYRQFEKDIPGREKTPMAVRYLQAAYAARSSEILTGAGEQFPNLPRTFTGFLQFSGAFMRDDRERIATLASNNWENDRGFYSNLTSLWWTEMDQSGANGQSSRLEWLQELIPVVFHSQRDILSSLLFWRVESLANAGQQDACRAVLNQLDTYLPAQPRLVTRAFLLRGGLAKQFDDAAGFNALFWQITDRPEIGPDCLSWLYLMKGEWLKQRGRADESLDWFNRVIEKFPNEMDAWLWAHYQRATLLIPRPDFQDDMQELTRILKSFEPYQKQMDAIRRLIDKSRSPEEIRQKRDETLAAAEIRAIRVSSQEEGVDGPEALVDGLFHTRWGSEHGKDPSWVQIEFNRPRTLNGVKIFWERAAAREYDVQVSSDGMRWDTVSSTQVGQEDATVLVSFNREGVRFLKLLMKSRATRWGYSIWEIVCY